MAKESESESQRSGDGKIEIGVLGPIVGTRNGEPLQLGGAKQLCVLASLISASPKVVTADELALTVYGEDAPERGRRRAQTYVSTLRSVLGDSIVRQLTDGFSSPKKFLSTQSPLKIWSAVRTLFERAPHRIS